MKTRTVQDVELPAMPTPRRLPGRLKRMPEHNGGHVIYRAGEESRCPRHSFCSYTGTEKTRCHVCHSNTHLTDEHDELPPGRKSPCLCTYCGELFTSITAFDIHQPGGICYRPAKRGLILIEQNGWVLWGKPGSRPE